MNEALQDSIGDYELIELIGDGAQGKVFKARRRAAGGETVALKILRVPPDDDQARARFEAKADILKRLDHPHLVRYRDSFTWRPGEWDEAQCLVMDYLEGETLAARLGAARRGLPWPDVQRIFEQCLDGLIYAAREGIIHRDLKPSNIFLTRDGSVRIFDFDIARIEGESQRSTLGWKGSFDFMAPDFITEPDFHGDELSDIFSLGVCICQALTGRLPFEPFGDNAHIGYLNRWRNAAAPPAPSFNAGVYRVLAHAKSFAGRSLSLRRAERFPSFAGMLQDFRRIRPRVVEHQGKDAYELRELLGRGGFGEVFAGVRLGDGRSVAIKHLFAEGQSPRFVKEARILQRYHHPNLVRYVDFIEVQNAARESQYFLILELLDGMPDACLRHRIKREGKIVPAEAIPLFLNYLGALDFLHGHARPLIHRDIKPMNLYAPAGHPEQAKIFDLGVARDVSGTVTSGGIPGTLDYMAPEFALPGTDRGSPQTDIYALGLCLYESLTGQPAFPRLPPDINSSWPMFQERARTNPAVDYRARVYRMYPDLAAAVRKAIDFQPTGRYAGASAMRQDLEKVLLRLDRPDEVSALEEPAVMTTSASAPAGNKSRAPAAEPGGPGAPDDAEPDVADLPELADDASDASGNRRRRAIRAALVILALLAAAVGATVWLSDRGAVPPPALVIPKGPACKPAAPQPSEPPAPQPVEPAAPTLAATPEVPPPADAMEDAAAMKAAREDMEQTARAVRIPIADPAYLERLSAAVSRARLIGEGYPELADEADRAVRDMEQHGRDLPALFQSGLAMALSQKDMRKAAGLLDSWRSVRSYAALMGLTPKQAMAAAGAMEHDIGRWQLDAAAGEVRSLAPGAIMDGADLEQAEQAAEALEMTARRSWPGVTASEKQATLAALRAALAAAMKAGLDAWQDEAVGLYRQGRDGTSRHVALASLPERAPLALALVHGDYLAAMAAVNAAQAEWDLLARRRQAILRAIGNGMTEMDREALAAWSLDPRGAIETAAAVRRVRAGFDALALLEATEPARVFLGTVADCWKKAARCEGPLGDAVRDAVWAAIHDQLVAQSASLLQPREMMLAGVRTPEQQARVRREFLRLLAQVETVTGRVSGCSAEDPLRVQVSRFFQPPFFQRSLLEKPSFADAIPWLAEEVRNALFSVNKN